MKILARFLIVFGLLEFVAIGVEEWTGVAYITGYAPPGRYVRKQDRPDRFHDAISLRTLMGFLLIGAGVVAWEIGKRSEECDPESPNYAGSKAMDDWSKSLDMEAERRGLKKPKHDEGDPPL